jgi:hypothetical protein
MEFGIVVSSLYANRLPKLESFYMEYEDEHSENIEGGYAPKSERLFWIRHKQIDQFIQKMGESNFFSLHRVFLSYYDAFSKLKYFWEQQIPNEIGAKGAEVLIDDIEIILKFDSLDINNSGTLKYSTHILNNGKKNWMEINPFQEYLWSTQMNELFKAYRISAFDIVTIKEKSLFHSSYLFKGAIVKKEISSVLYEWANINSYNQTDFIKRINNILEVIINDVRRNKEEYSQKSKLQEVNNIVYSLVNQINTNPWRKYFFGIFNASNLLGSYSRHSSHEIKSIMRVNTQGDISCKKIIDEWWDNNTLPSDDQFNKIFKLWYFTTSYLVINWLRLPHFTP